MAGRKRGGYSQTARCIRILETLVAKGGGVSFESLVDEFGVTDRQLRRDLAALEEAGHFIELAVVGGKRGARLKERRTGSLTLTLRERYTLLAMRRVFTALEGTPFHEDIESIYAKLATAFGSKGRKEIDRLANCFAYLPDGGIKAYDGKEDVLDAILTGVIRRVRVRYGYKGPSGRARSGVFEPYALVLYKQGLYVIARPVPEEGSNTENSKPYVYAAERFTDAEHVRGDSFELPEEFSVDKYLDGAFGIYVGGEPQDVSLEFDARAVPFVEARVWHPRQKVTKLSGGRLQLDLQVSDTTQLAQWIVGWGPLVKVISPAPLAERVKKEHEEALARYVD